MKKLVLVLLFTSGWSAMAQDTPAQDPIKEMRADLALAQRDYERLNSQCQIQIQATDQAKKLVALLKQASTICQKTDQALDTETFRCVAKPKEK